MSRPSPARIPSPFTLFARLLTLRERIAGLFRAPRANAKPVTEFFHWLEQKHPGWEMPRLFVQVRMLARCRTLDLCQVKTADLGAELLTLTAEATKTREARTVPLPADVVTALRRVAGRVWLTPSAGL